MKSAFVSIVLPMLIQPISVLPNGVRIINICYVPIAIETYMPMTLANIEQHCVRIGQVSASDRRYLDLKTVIERAESGSLDNEAIRVKLIEPDQNPIYIDNAGGVGKGKSQRQLSASSLAKVKHLVEEMTVPMIR